MSRTTALRRSFLINLLVMVSAVVLLQACGSDKKAPPPVVDAVPTGYYGTSSTGVNSTADVFEDDNITDLNIENVQGMVYNGRFIMMSLNSLNIGNSNKLSYDGPITVSGNNFSGTVSIYRNGLLIGTAPVTGTITQGSTITGTLTGTGAGRGSFTLNYSPKNSEAAALSIVGKTWPGLIGGSTSIFNLTVDGTTGALTSNATTDGVFQACTLAVGSVMTPIVGQHLYTVSLTLSSCNTSAADGAYTGLATTRNLIDNNMPFAVSKGAYSVHTRF